MGATPITSAAAAHGHTAHFSNPERSLNELFAACVTLPKNTRWYIHSRYTALQITPVAASMPKTGLAWNAPLNTRNSPMNPFSNGSPADASTIARYVVAYTGIGEASPPNSLISYV